ATGKRFLVGILNVLREVVNEFVKTLLKTLRTGVKRARGERRFGGERNVALQQETFAEAGVVRTENRLANAGGDEHGREVFLAGDGEVERLRAGGRFHDDFDVGHFGALTEHAGN